MYTKENRNILNITSWITLIVGSIALILCFAFADVAHAAVETTTSETDFIGKMVDYGPEYGGTTAESPYENPDGNGDGYGDNIAFSVPAYVNFVMRADGKLIGPSNIAIENHGNYPIHVSSMKAVERDGWSFAENEASATGENSVVFIVGPSDNMLNAYKCLTKQSVTKPVAWNIGALGLDNDSLAISMSGRVFNVTKSLEDWVSFGQIQWFVQAGEYVIPSLDD